MGSRPSSSRSAPIHSRPHSSSKTRHPRGARRGNGTMKKPEITEVGEGISHEVLPLAPSMGPALENVRAPTVLEPVDRRVVLISGVSILLAIAAGFVAQLLTRLISFFT